jgi:hypothetical protein
MTEISLRTRSTALATVNDLFQEKVKTLDLALLRRLASALQGLQTDAEELVRAVEAVYAVKTSTSDDHSVHTLKGTGLGKLVPREAGAAAIEALTVNEHTDNWAESELLGAGETAMRIDVARASLDNWRRAHKVIAFRKGVRNFVYPIRQFKRHRPLEGIEQVWAQFKDDDVAWDWLIAANPQTGGVAPIDWLQKGKIEEVVRAAEGEYDYQ